MNNVSKIQELINDLNTILVFDVDGVLARIEHGKYNHFNDNDEEYDLALKNGVNFYDNSIAIKTMQDYIKTRCIDNIYICSHVHNDIEASQKIIFLEGNYNIKRENIYFVNENEEKLDVLNKIKSMYPNVQEDHIALVDDTLSILNHVMNNSNYATIHFSSFIH